MLPQLGVGGWTERPRKASEPSSTMIVATAIKPKETTVGMMLGRISRARMRLSLAPERLGGQDEVAGGVGERRRPHHPEDQRRAEDADDERDLPQSVCPQKETMAITATMAGKASTTYEAVLRTVSTRPRR